MGTESKLSIDVNLQVKWHNLKNAIHKGDSDAKARFPGRTTEEMYAYCDLMIHNIEHGTSHSFKWKAVDSDESEGAEQSGKLLIAIKRKEGSKFIIDRYEEISWLYESIEADK